MLWQLDTDKSAHRSIQWRPAEQARRPFAECTFDDAHESLRQWYVPLPRVQSAQKSPLSTWTEGPESLPFGSPLDNASTWAFPFHSPQPNDDSQSILPTTIFSMLPSFKAWNFATRLKLSSLFEAILPYARIPLRKMALPLCGRSVSRRQPFFQCFKQNVWSYYTTSPLWQKSCFSPAHLLVLVCSKPGSKFPPIPEGGIIEGNIYIKYILYIDRSLKMTQIWSFSKYIMS